MKLLLRHFLFNVRIIEDMLCKTLRYKIGLSLSIIGVTIGMLLNYAFPVMKWSPIIMFLSIALLFSKSMFRGTVKVNKFFVAILSFQIIMIAYLFITAKSPTVLPKYLPFHLFVIFFSFVLMRNKEIKYVNFLPILFYFTSLLTIIAAVIVYLDLVAIDIQLRKEETILEVFTLDMASYANMIAGICLLKGKSYTYRIIIYIFILIDIYVIIKSGKRSYFVSVVIAIIFYLYKNRLLFKGLGISGVVLIVLLLVLPQVRESTLEIINRTTDGFSTVYFSNKTQVYDENNSASIRKINQKKLLKDVDENFGIVHVFTGKGYLYAFIDNPLLESFLDMGIIGFIYYCYIILAIPFLFYKRIRKGNDFDLFLFLNSIVNITVIITNNNPYEYFVYTPACLMAMRYDEVNKRKNINVVIKHIKNIIAVRLKLKTMNLESKVIDN